MAKDQKYETLKDGWIDGRFVAAGTDLTMTEGAAQYLELSGQIGPASKRRRKSSRAEAAAEAAPAPEPKPEGDAE